MSNHPFNSNYGTNTTVLSADINSFLVGATTSPTPDTGSYARFQKIGTIVNLERCLQFNGRIDGHIVQGHVDQNGNCTSFEETNGSWYFTFKYDNSLNNITIEKGSITVNGVSLTVVNSNENEFSVAIIPYTFEHTNFKNIKVGSVVNLEFDVIGKYITRLHSFKK
jgi:riboflavin synthase